MQNHISKRDQENGVNKDKSSAETSPNAKNDKVNSKSKDGIVYEDNLQCKFNPRNFKILYVIDSENCFYRKLALTRAKNSHKAVSRRKAGDFGRWHSQWLKKNVSESSQTSINEWFMGKCEGLVPNRTHKITKADLERTPYRTYYKYRAEIVKTTSNSSNGPTSSTSPSNSSTTPSGGSTGTPASGTS